MKSTNTIALVARVTLGVALQMKCKATTRVCAISVAYSVALILSHATACHAENSQSGFVRVSLFGPSNYWECILGKMPGVQNDYVAAQIVQSCLAEFHNTGPVPDKDKVHGMFSVPHASECVLKYGKDTASALGGELIVAACHALYFP